jgi:hypothetical protein
VRPIREITEARPAAASIRAILPAGQFADLPSFDHQLRLATKTPCAAERPAFLDGGIPRFDNRSFRILP